MKKLVPTEADKAVNDCIGANKSFALIAGAGSGKTSSLIAALSEIRAQSGSAMRRNGQKAVCITYTNRAVEVIRRRLGFDDIFMVNTLHGFLWGEIARFQNDIRLALHEFRIPTLLAKAREKDTGKDNKEAAKARLQVLRLEGELAGVRDVPEFTYGDSSFSDYLKGQLSHDDIIEVSSFLLGNRKNFRRLIGMRYPYIFVDEAQDTFTGIVSGLNQMCTVGSLPLVGYFGDPWQQIYEGRAGDFAPPPGGETITKTENFRSAPQIIQLLNSLRPDVQQVAAGDNKDVVGSVRLCLVRAEEPEGERKRYSEAQVSRALSLMDRALTSWGWENKSDVVRLFLVRQMIARRLGFSALHQLFTGQYASTRAQDDYESGEHFLLRHFVKTICPLLKAFDEGNSREAIDILRTNSPAYDVRGRNAKVKLSEMIGRSKRELAELADLWNGGSVKDVLNYCMDHEIIAVSDRLRTELTRAVRAEAYDEVVHAEDKGEWLADLFLAMTTTELQKYCDFILKNTSYSTQHGVKGEEYPNVLVVFDDVEANWNLYSFTKLFVPGTAGEPTDGQRDRGRKLAYVSFSRAEQNLRVLMFTANPESSRDELVAKGIFAAEQVDILELV